MKLFYINDMSVVTDIVNHYFMYSVITFPKF